MRTQFWSENLKGRGHSDDFGLDWEIILEWILGKWDWMMWTGCIWFRIGTSDGLLLIR